MARVPFLMRRRGRKRSRTLNLATKADMQMRPKSLVSDTERCRGIQGGGGGEPNNTGTYKHTRAKNGSTDGLWNVVKLVRRCEEKPGVL